MEITLGRRENTVTLWGDTVGPIEIKTKNKNRFQMSSENSAGRQEAEEVRQTALTPPLSSPSLLL